MNKDIADVAAIEELVRTFFAGMKFLEFQEELDDLGWPDSSRPRRLMYTDSRTVHGKYVELMPVWERVNKLRRLLGIEDSRMSQKGK